MRNSVRFLSVLITATLLLISNYSFSQAASWNYTITGSSCTAIDMTTATQINLNSGNNDDGGALVAWPFPFYVYNSGYGLSNNLTMNTNGYMRFDAAIGLNSNMPIPSGPSSYLGQFLSYGGNTDGTVIGNIMQKVTGLSPNRIWTIGLTYNTDAWGGSWGYQADIQVSFYETTNEIRVGYHNVTIGSNSAANLGINAGDNIYYNVIPSFPTSDTCYTYAPSSVPAVTNPTNFTPTVVNTSQINLGWGLNGNNNDVIVIYNTVNNFAAPSNGQSYSVGNQISPGQGWVLYKGSATAYNHSSLTPNTKYYYTIYSYNNIPIYSSGVLDSATTQAIADPTNFTATTTSATEIALAWTKNTANNNVMVAFNTSNNFATPTDGNTYPVGNQIATGQGTIIYSGSGTTYNHQNLTANTTYYYKIWSYNAGKYYSIGVGTFANTTTVAPPQGITATATSGSQVNVSWIKNAIGNDVIVAYNTTNSFDQPTNGTNYSLGGYLGSSGAQILYIGNLTSKNHTGLIPNTNYYYKVWSKTSNNIYSTGIIDSATTLGVDPPQSLQANATSPSQVVLTWVKNTANNNVIIAYSTTNVFGTPANGNYYASSTMLPGNNGEVIYNGSATFFMQNSLTSNTKYYYKIWSYDATAVYSSSLLDSATTIGVLDPQSITATTFSATQINLSWIKNISGDDVMIAHNTTNNFDTPVDQGNYISGNIMGASGAKIVYIGSATSAVDASLVANTKYYYKIWSKTATNFFSSPGLLDSATTMSPGIAVFPYVQDFESVTPATYTSYPSCAGTYTLTNSSGLFEWVNVSNDNIDFIPVIGAPYPTTSGPSGDHTSGSGVYLYSTSYYNCQYQTAYIESPTFNFTNTSNPVLEFYYHMYGSYMGSLSVQVSTNGGQTWSGNIFTKSGQQHTSASSPWTLASVSLASYAAMPNIKIRFKALTGGYYSDMAIDDIKIFNSQPMLYSSSTCTQSTEPVIHGQTNQEVIKVNILTNGDQNPISSVQLFFSSTGTTSLSDISNAKVYYTGGSNVFSTANQFGSTVASVGANFSMSGTQALENGNNYFWLTYDIPATATFGNVVDACCTYLVAGAGAYTPTVTCPPGNNLIKGYQTVNTGTGSGYDMPMHYYYNSACEMIYTSAEMGTAKDIAKLAFYKASGANTNNVQNISIYMKNTTASSLASGTYSLSGYTQVFSGSFPNTAPSGWMEVALSTPFTYDGTSNVEVLVVQLISTYVAGYPYWSYGFVTGSNRCRYANSYNVAPSSLTLGTSNRLPNIRFEYSLPTVMAYSHCTSNQTDTSFVKPGDVNKAVLRMDVTTINSVNPLKVKGFSLNTTGTSNLSDISNAKIYYTGTSNMFAATNQFGSTIPTPGATLTFNNDSVSLQGGTNYFWLTYDIKTTATFNNYIDAECTAIIVDDTSRTPILTAPNGRRQIKPYVIVGTGAGSSYQFPLGYPLFNVASEMIYLQSEFGTGAKDIINFAFEKASGNNNVDSVKNVSIYMKHTTATTLSSGTYSIPTYTLVYSGSFTNNAVSGWMEVTLDVPFAYNGTQNLEVLVIQEEDVYFASYPYWANSTITPNRCRTAYDYNAVPTNLTSSSSFPNTRFEYTIPTPMIYVSSEVTQNDLTGVLQGGTNQVVIGIEVETNGSLNPLSATSFNINTTGTTNLSDISNAKIYYTGINSSFSATNQFGATVVAPTSSFVVYGSQALMNGTNHFWLTYNISSTATLGNFIDAECTSINVGGAKTPSVTAPTGSRMISGAMSGAYTIGTGGNYPTFTSAINALNLFGISGPVQFNVISGTYSEQIVLTPVTGVSATNNIVFQSQSGDSTDVTLQYSASNTNANYTVKLNGADYITFKGMTIKALGTTYGRVVEIGNNSDWNVFTNNRIISTNANGSSYSAGFYSYQSGGANDNHFMNNNIDINGYYAFYIQGTSSALQQNNIIENNIINNNTYAVYGYYQNNLKIKSNIITGNYATASNYVLMMYYCDGQTEIIGNEIRLNGSSTNYGIYYYASDATSANPALIANNFITQLSGNNCYGLYFSNSNYVNVYNNNFNITSSGTSRGLYLASGSNVNFVNNIVNCSGGGYATYVNNTSALVTSDYNDLFTNGSYIGRWGSTDITTLASWKSTTNKDANSISVNPMYTSTIDLHVNNFAMDNLGTPIAIITDDIDGELRDPATPDIGADEFYQNYDIESQTITSPANGVCSGNHNIITTIKNNGIITLTSATINWSVNNVAQTPFSWSGLLVNGASTSVTLGSYSFTSGNYNILVETANPNGQTDQWTVNDTSAKTVTVYGLASVSAGNDEIKCSGTDLTISTATASNYSALNWSSLGTGTWTNGTTLTPTYTPSAADTSNGSVQLILTAIGFAGCGNVSDTMTLTLNAAPVVSFSGLASTYCPDASPATLIGTPTGGTFSGTGISGNIFNPSNAGAGTHTITYSKMNSSGCAGISTFNTTVYPITTVTLSGLGASYCINDSAVNLTTYPQNGTLSGNGTSGIGLVPGSNVAPSAVASASTCNTGACSSLNDLNFGTCETQQMWITSSASNPGSSVFIQFIWPTAHTIDKMTIHVGQSNTRFLTGGTIQVWNGSSWINHTTFTQSPGVCNYDINFSSVSTTQLRIINMTVGGSQSSNMNFREIEIFEVAQGGYIFTPSIAGVGTHTITYSLTEANGCTFTDSSTVIVNALPTVSFSGLAASYCSDAPNATLTGTPSGGTFSGTGISGNTFSPSTAGAGTYSIVYAYQGTNGCMNADTQSVVVNATPIANFTGLASSYCIDAPMVSLSGTPTGGTFSGSGMSGSTFNPAIAGAGTHSITYTKTTNSCTGAYSQNTTVYSLPIANAGSNVDVQYGNDTILYGSATGGSSSYSYSWSPASKINGSANIQNPSTVNISVTTEFILTVVDAVSGCQDTAHVTVTPLGGPLSANPNAQPDSICAGSSTQLNSLASGGTGVFTYSWASAPAGFTSTVANPTVSPSVTTTYTVTVSSGSQNVISSVVVTVIPLPLVSFTGLSSSYCANDAAVTMVGSPIGGIFVGNGVNGNIYDPSTVMPGLDSVKYLFTNSFGCSNYALQNVTVNALPIVTITGPDSVILGNSTNLIGSVGGSSTYSYQWGPASAIFGSTTLQNCSTTAFTSTRIFTLTITDIVTGCSNTTSDTIYLQGSQLQALVSATPDSICQGSSSQLSTLASGGTGIYTYAWSSSPAGFSSTLSNPTVSPTITTTYTVTVTSATQDTTSSVVVSVGAIPVVSFTGLATSYCADDAPATLIGSPVGGTFSGNGMTVNIFDPSTVVAGNHTINYSYTTSFGCSNNVNHNTTVNEIPLVTITGPDTVLIGQDTILYGSASGGSSTYSYSWGPASSIFGSTTLQNCTTTAIMIPTQFTLTVTDLVSGCSSSTTKMVIPKSVGPLQALAIANPDTICQGDSAQLNAYASGGVGTYTYLWSSNPLGFTSTLSNAIVNPINTTTYTVTVSDGITSTTSSAVLTVAPMPIVSFNGLAATYCSNQNADTLIGTPVGGTFSGAGIVGNIFDPAIAGQGTHTISYTYTNMGGCIGTDIQSVIVNAAPNANAGSDIIIVCGAAGQAIGSASAWGIIYNWTPSLGLSASNISNPVASPPLTTLYTLTATDTATGCIATDDILVKVTGGPTALASADTIICHGSTVTLTASGGVSYLWSTNDTTSSIVVTPTVTTSYIVTVYDANACADSDTINVSVNNPTVDLGQDMSLAPSQALLLDAGAGFSQYLWSTGAITQSIIVDSVGIGLNNPTNISVTVTDSLGCQGSDDMNVTFTDVGLEDINENINITLFPNPTKGIVTITVKGYTGSNVNMEIVDVRGRLVYDEKVNLFSNKYTKQIDLSTNPKGVYFIRLFNNDFNKVEKIIIQ